ncbi:glycosyltransferase [Hahella sp. HN01]|uniref:glycosyltransferase n=1 Tax=Hahella sp. HN01 TaxID=2847262 RepID=UPI001C1ECDA4|nr:glycosyltransferase [Hahella sp. HN01]MBU6949949.1 glycosyltransferase [Hahella sp. HN01]
MSFPPSPLVSIYITTKNREDLILRAVNSALAQTYTNIEIIIVDDASTDSTRHILEELKNNFNNISIITHTKSKGACASRNAAILKAKGKYVTGLDDDDYFLPERVSTLLEHNKETYSFICSDQYICLKEGVLSHKKSTINTLTLNEMLYSNFATNQVLVEREKIIAAGLFDEELSSCQDYDMWLRLVIKYGPGFRIQIPLIVFDQTPGRERISTNKSKIPGFELFIEKHQHIMKKPHMRAQQLRLTLAKNNKLSFLEVLKYSSYRTLLRDIRIWLRGYYLK